MGSWLHYLHWAWHLIEGFIVMALSLDYMAERDRRARLDVVIDELEEEEGGPRVIS
jgi:hypothetical protein